MSRSNGVAGAGRHLARLAVGLLACLAALPAAASDDPYSRIGVGAARIDRSTNDTGWNIDLAAGGQFSPRRPAVAEVAVDFQYLPRASGTSADAFTTFELSLLYKFNSSEDVDFYGRLGGQGWALGNWLGSQFFSSSIEKGLGWTYGLGIQSRIGPGDGIRLEWQAYTGLQGTNADKITLSWIRYR
jgi:hypothetical protein